MSLVGRRAQAGAKLGVPDLEVRLMDAVDLPAVATISVIPSVSHISPGPGGIIWPGPSPLLPLSQRDTRSSRNCRILRCDGDGSSRRDGPAIKKR